MVGDGGNDIRPHCSMRTCNYSPTSNTVVYRPYSSISTRIILCFVRAAYWLRIFAVLTIRAIGLVVEYIVAIDGTRVRFPDGAIIFVLEFFWSTLIIVLPAPMKFGHQLSELVDPKFRNYCLSYNMLKGYIRGADSKSVNVIQTISDVTSAAVPYLPQAPAEQLQSVQFQEVLTNELEKLNKFSELEQETLLTDLRAVVRKAHALDRSLPDSDAAVELLRTETDRIASEICAFAGFVNLNHTAFRKITKKEAKVHRTSTAAWFMANVARAPFMTVDFDRLLTAMSICYELLRSSQPAIESTPVARGPSRPNRVLSAWIASEDLWQVKVALAKVMSLELVVQGGSRQGLLETVLAPTARRGKESAVQAHHNVEASYFDTPWLEFYRDQASGKQPSGFQVESEGEAVTVSLPSGNRFTVASNVWTEIWSTGAKSCEDILVRHCAVELKSLVKAGVVPLVECSYTRYVFHCEDESHGQLEVRVEEDGSFTSGKEKLVDKHSKFQGHALYVSLPSSSAAELPDWLLDITGLPGVTEVPNFTKRVHGLFVYADNRIGAGIPFPSWVVQKAGNLKGRPLQGSPRVSRPASVDQNLMSLSPPPPRLEPILTDIMQPVSLGASVLAKANSTLRLAMREGRSYGAWLVGNSAIHKSPRIQIRDSIVKIEPKSFFACERTLLDWTHTCVVVTGLAALHGGVVGITVAVIPILVLLWETRLYRVRNMYMVEKEGTGYSDRFGPVLLFVALVCLAVDILMKSAVGLVAR